MALSEAEIAKCAKWCTAPARKWQVLNRGKWKYQFHEKTLVRFVEEVKMDEELCPLLLEYLASDDCRSTLQLYGQAVDSAWTPIRAWYEISNKSVGNVHAIRLYHALALEPEAIGDGPYIIEDGCAYRVSWTYYWKRESVQQAPQSISGISYHIVNLQRDPETGLFNYAIEKRERVQQDIPEYVTGVTTTHETREEVHHGVRGALDVGGKPASVGGGKTVRRKVTKNADCTHDVHNETVKELPSPKHSKSVSVGLTGTVETTTDLNMPEPLPTDGLDIGQHVENTKTEGGLWRRVFRKLVPNALIKIAASCHKTLFSHSHSDTTVQSNDPGFTHVEEAGGGVVHDKRVSRTADGAYQITDSTTTEKPVQKSHEVIHVGLSGKTRSVTHRNQSAPAPEPTDIGESVENSRTEGGLWNVTIRTLVKNALIKIGDACSKTVFQHSHSNTKVQSSDPGESNVSSASGGVIHERRVSRTADGAFQINDSTTTELPVGDASESTSIGLEGTVKTTQRRNQPNKAPDPTDIGESVENTKTPGGLWNHTIRQRVLRSIIKLGENCRKTFFSHSHSKSIVQGSDPGFDHVAEAANGTIRDKRVSRTATGAFRVDESETTEKPVRDAVVEIAKTLRGTRKTVTHKSQQDAVSEVGLKIGERRSTRKTDGGLNDNTISTPTGEPAGKIAKGESKTIFEDVATERENIAAGGELPSRSADSAGDGKTHSVDVHLNEDGSADVIKRDKTEKAVADAGEIINVSLEGKTKTVIKRNQSAKEPEPGDNEIGKSVENTKTEGGRWNIRVRTVVKGALLRLGEACRKSIFEHRHSKTTVQSDDPGFSHAEEAGNGKVVSKSVTRTATGAFRVDESETTEKPVRDAVVTKRMTLNGLSVQRTHRNQSTPLPDPTKVGKSVSNRKTDGGRYDVTDTEEGAIPAGETGESCLRDAFTHHHAVTKNEKEPQDVETMFERGKIIRKTATLTGNGTANNSTDTTTAVPKINKYTYTRDDDAIVHVIKYRNQQDIPGYPDGAVGLQINDSLNAFELHDGVISYLTNAPYKVTFGDLKFIKHGASQKFYEIVYSRRTRRFKHRVWTVQIHHIKGDAYTDYVSDWQRADIGRTTSGVMCTQLISRYKDKDGNELAEWKWVELTQPPGAWVICTQSCNHQWKEFSQEDFRKAAKALLAGGGDTSADNDKFHKDLIATLKNMPIATAAAMQGVTPETMKDEIARLDEARRAAAAQEAADAAARKDAEGGGK